MKQFSNVRDSRTIVEPFIILRLFALEFHDVCMAHDVTKISTQILISVYFRHGR